MLFAIPSWPYPPSREGYWGDVSSTINWCEEVRMRIVCMYDCGRILFWRTVGSGIRPQRRTCDFSRLKLFRTTAGNSAVMASIFAVKIFKNPDDIALHEVELREMDSRLLTLHQHNSANSTFINLIVLPEIPIASVSLSRQHSSPTTIQ
jgi:hypothetical protein